MTQPSTAQSAAQHRRSPSRRAGGPDEQVWISFDNLDELTYRCFDVNLEKIDFGKFYRWFRQKDKEEKENRQAAIDAGDSS